jgi:hypothetical protein
MSNTAATFVADLSSRIIALGLSEHRCSVTAGPGLGYALDDLGASPAGENFMGLANRQRSEVDSFELAQLRAHIGRIAAKSGVPVNPKHAQVRTREVLIIHYKRAPNQASPSTPNVPRWGRGAAEILAGRMY